MIQKTWILVREAVVVLLPNVGSKQVVQGRNLATPWQFARHLQPLGVLTEHGVNNADKRFVTIEQTVGPVSR